MYVSAYMDIYTYIFIFLVLFLTKAAFIGLVKYMSHWNEQAVYLRKTRVQSSAYLKEE